MSLLKQFQIITHELQKEQIEFALVGGLASSLYRKEPRATADIDLALMLEDEKIAQKILEKLNLKIYFLRKADLEGGPQFAIKKQNTPVYILCGRGQSEVDVGIDLLLSRLLWVANALDRAKNNRIDFGFGAIPCITVEDLIISKLYSLKNQASRFMDMDDLRSIFESKSNEIDWVYVYDQIKKFNLQIPKLLKPFVKKL